MLFTRISNLFGFQSQHIYPACKNWGCKVLDWFNSPIYRLATTLWRTVLLAQNAKMGQKWHLIFRLRFEPIWCLVPTGARHNKFGSTANLQETAVRPTVFSNRDTFLFYLKRYLSILLLPVVSTCNTSVYARMRIPYTVRGSTSVLNIKKERF